MQLVTSRWLENNKLRGVGEMEGMRYCQTYFGKNNVQIHRKKHNIMLEVFMYNMLEYSVRYLA